MFFTATYLKTMQDFRSKIPLPYWIYFDLVTVNGLTYGIDLNFYSMLRIEMSASRATELR